MSEPRREAERQRNLDRDCRRVECGQTDGETLYRGYDPDRAATTTISSAEVPRSARSTARRIESENLRSVCLIEG